MMVYWVWQERKVHEMQESIEMKKTLVESMSMEGDISLVYNMIELWYI